MDTDPTTGAWILNTGTQDIGTGQRTVMGVVTADAMGVPVWVMRDAAEPEAEKATDPAAEEEPNSAMDDVDLDDLRQRRTHGELR